MGRRVLVIASGETERRALPHLLTGTSGEVITLLGVVHPPRHRAITLESARSLQMQEWFSRQEADRPDKFVILVDADARTPGDAVARLGDIVERVRPQIVVPILVVAAKWHLEAGFVADEAGLRAYLGRDLGAVDASRPDAIENPKHHLRNLLGERIYTAALAEEIARAVKPGLLRRSPSFRAFGHAVRNGAR